MANAPANQVAKTLPIWDEDTLADIASFHDAIELLKSSGAEIVSTEDFGDGFRLTDKPTLVGTPFLIMDMRIHPTGDHGPFAILRLVTEDGRKCVITDGSTGIKEQVAKYLSKNIEGALLVPRGLIRSDYDYTDDKGNVKAATTYYLS